MSSVIVSCPKYNKYLTVPSQHTGFYIFAPFVVFWGGVAQFIAGLMGYPARDTLVTVIHTLWGSFWISTGILFGLMTTDIVPLHGLHSHFPEVASWMVVLAVFTWSCAVASVARDLVLCGVLTTLAIGTTIACCLFAYGSGVNVGMYVAAYFWMLSALLAWFRVTVYLLEEAFGEGITKFVPSFPTPWDKNQPMVAPGVGECGVKSPKKDVGFYRPYVATVAAEVDDSYNSNHNGHHNGHP